jgi:hypothetical protein
MARKNTLAPSDSLRRKERAKELVKNKRMRTAIREVAVSYKDPDVLREQIGKYAALEVSGLGWRGDGGEGTATSPGW